MLQINLLVLSYSYRSISASLTSFILAPASPPAQRQPFSHRKVLFCLPFPSHLVIAPRDPSLSLHLTSLPLLQLLRLALHRENRANLAFQDCGRGTLLSPHPFQLLPFPH